MRQPASLLLSWALAWTRRRALRLALGLAIFERLVAVRQALLIPRVDRVGSATAGD